jgi:hypothetical protein
MYWWLWLVLGLVLVGLEILTPGGFYVIFFGIGALVVGTLVGLGVSGPVWFQWLLFSALSLVALFVFRPYLVRWTRSQVVNELDKASEPWGIKVLRYEIKNISPPKDVLAAMEKQMRAEREKRAVILTSEGERDAAINSAEGQKQQVIKASEARKQQQINEAEGAAAAILAIADATSEGIRKVAESIQVPGGYEAVQLRVAEQYIGKFGELANATDTTMIVPASVADIASMIGMAMNVIGRQRGGPVGAEPRAPGPDQRQPGAM